MSNELESPVCSVIIPTYNEAENIPRILDSLLKLNQPIEIIVVDGGSSDTTLETAEKYPHVRALESGKGRAKQMNIGAEHANFSPLLFLHADTIIPDNLLYEAQKIDDGNWGYFNIKINSPRLIFRIIELMMNMRCRITHVITGDMAITIDSDLFHRLGKYHELDLMEDVEISKRLRKMRQPCRMEATVLTSARRWEKHGIFNTIWLMWKLRLGHFMGLNVSRMINKYNH